MARKERHFMRNHTMSHQMEMSFQPGAARSQETRRALARKTAQWWFQHMRRIVADAIDWSAPTPPRAAQISLALSDGKA